MNPQTYFLTLGLRTISFIIYFIFGSFLDAKPILINEKVFVEVNRDYSVKVNIEMEFENAKGFASILAFPENEFIKYKDFHAFWNNKRLAVEKENPVNGNYFQVGNEYYTSLYKFTVTNKSAKTAIHRIRYHYDPFYYANQKYDEKEGYLVEYILKTGNLWNKNIKKLFIQVKFQEPICHKAQRLEPTYEGFCKNKYLWEYQGNNIDLTENLELLIVKNTKKEIEKSKVFGEKQ